MKFSIIIPTYNEEIDIAATLEALLGVDYADKEIIIVDDSNDRTPEIVRGYADRGVRLIHPGGGGRCEARNIGIREAAGEVVVLLNADVRLPVDFLQRVARHYQQGADYVLVAARVANRQDLFGRYVDCVSDVFYAEGARSNYANIEWTEGFSCRREVALKAGLFPTGFPVPICAGEDGFFGQGLRAIAAKKAIDLSLQVDHVVPATFREFWRNRQGRGAGSAQVHRFLDRWPWWKILLWNTLKTIKTLLWIGTLAPALGACLEAVRYSERGLADMWPFFYAYTVEQVAAQLGEWQATFAIMRKERGGPARMRVTISLMGRFWAFDLARELERHGYLERLITSYPVFETVKYGVRREHICSLILNEILNRGWRQAPDWVKARYNAQYLLHEFFDHRAARHLPPSRNWWWV